MVPLLANGRFGLPGVWFNNDLSLHLLWTEQLRHPDVSAAAGELSARPARAGGRGRRGAGTGVDRAFAGLLAAVSVLGALTAVGALHVLRTPWRVLAAVVTGLGYLMAAYYAQGAFKETDPGPLVLGFAVGLIELERGRLSPRRCRSSRSR